jgi:hypothetical protein
MMEQAIMVDLVTVATLGEACQNARHSLREWASRPPGRLKEIVRIRLSDQTESLFIIALLTGLPDTAPNLTIWVRLLWKDLQCNI